MQASLLVNNPRTAVPSKPAQSIEVSWIAGVSEPSTPWPESQGSLAISFCPGKRVGALRRDAKADLQCLKTKHQIDVVVCLLNEAELRVLSLANFRTLSLPLSCPGRSKNITCNGLQSLGLREYGKRVEEEGMTYLVFPVIDMCAPDDPDQARRLVETIAQQYLLGRNILVHCRYAHLLC